MNWLSVKVVDLKKSQLTSMVEGVKTTITPKINLLRLNDFVCNSFFETTTFITFTLTFQSNNLTYHKPYTKKQQTLYQLIKYLHEVEGLGYRKISQKMNSWGIPTIRGKKWFPQSVFSVLKRKHQRDMRVEQVRNKHFPTKISKMKVVYYILLINQTFLL